MCCFRIPIFYQFKYYISLCQFEFKSVTYKPDCPVPIIEQSQKLMIAASLARAGKLYVDFLLKIFEKSTFHPPI
jgi:hypothetical protein